MKARHLLTLTLMLVLALSPACHLNLLLEGEGFACATDDNCPEGLRCAGGACVRGAGDAAASDGQAQDAAQPDLTVVDSAGADHALTTDAALPDTQVSTDTSQPDVATLPDTASAPDAVGADSGPADAGHPCDAPAVSVLVSGLNKPARLVLANGALYWTSFADGGAVMRHVLASSSTQVIGTVPAGLKPYAIAVDATHVYVASSGGVGSVDAVHRFTDAPASPAQLIADSIGILNQPFYNKVPNNLFVADGKVYWLMRGSQYNVCRHEAGVQAANIYDQARSRSSWPLGLVRLGNDLFVAEDVGQTGLTRHALTFAPQGDGTAVSSFSSAITDLAANTSLVFLAVAGGAATPGSIVTVDPQTTLTASLVAEVGPSNRGVDVLVMASDDTTLYFATEGYTGGSAQIHRRVLAESTSTPLAPADYPAGLAFDDDYVYWTEYSQNSIRRFPRCP